MEDKQFEELLRESWKPEPPDGMRERVLSKALPELGRRILAFPRFAISKWQVGLALAGLLLFLGCSLSDMSREKRLAALESSDYIQPSVTVAQRPITLGSSRVQAGKLLCDSSSDFLIP